MDKKYRTVEEAVNAVCGEASALACAELTAGSAVLSAQES